MPDDLTRVTDELLVGERDDHPVRTGWTPVKIVVLLFVLLLLAICLIVPHIPGGAQNLALQTNGPTTKHILGTDDVGRDVLYRVVAGLPWSIEVSAIAVAVALLLAGFFGIVGGWYEGIVSRLAYRVIDFYVAFPFIVFAIVLIAVVGRSRLDLGVVLGLGVWPILGRIIYGEVLQIKRAEFILYARIVRGSGRSVIFRHVIPSLFRRVSVVSAFVFADVLGASAALSLLGLGPSPETATLGNVLATGQEYLITAPWIVISASAALVLLIVSVNLLADRV
jgi:peptide/nickel transport system permease protein